MKLDTMYNAKYVDLLRLAKWLGLTVKQDIDKTELAATIYWKMLYP